MWQLSALVLSWLVFQLEGNHWLFLFVSKKNSTVTLELEPNSALGQIFVTNILLYSPVHKCWPKTSLSGNQGKHQNRPILATKEPLTAFHGSISKKTQKMYFLPVLSHIDALHINLSYRPKDQSHSFSQKIMRIDSFEKPSYFESVILDFFFKKFFFAESHDK